MTPGPILIFLNMGRPDFTNNPSLISNIPYIPYRLLSIQNFDPKISDDILVVEDSIVESELEEF